MVKYKTEIMAPDGVLLGVKVDGVEYMLTEDCYNVALPDSPNNSVNTTILDAIGIMLTVYKNGPHKPVADSPHKLALSYNRHNPNLTISPLVLSGLNGDLEWFKVGQIVRADSTLLTNILNIVMWSLRFNKNPAIA
jgi:hypothetical protein